MNNKCGCGCESGFVPVNSNWDFNMDGGCQPGSGYQRQRQNRCNACETAETNCRRNRQADCADRNACQKNTCTGRADCTCEKCMRRREADCNNCGNAYTNREKNTCTGRADCTCEKCMRRREADCNNCGNVYTNREKNTCTGRSDCTCEKCMRRREAEYNNCGKQKNKADNRGVGIMWAKKQDIDDVYDCGRALKAGTLYPELHKPLNGYWPCEAECGDRCQQIAFAMWELRLYLNTHPNDKEALMMLHKLQENCCEPNYATTFLEDVCCTDGTRNPGWRWKNDPWPWEYDANCGC